MNSTSTAQKEFGEGLTPLRIVAIYLVVGGLWILFSDQLLAALVSDPATLTRLGTLKGWFYVLVTAGLLYALIRRADETLQRRIEERTRELSTLLAISHTVVSTLELQPLLNLILEQLQEVVGYTGASVFIREGKDLCLRAHRGPFPQEEILRLSLSPGRALVREVILEQKPMLIPDVLGDSRSACEFRAWVGEYVAAHPGGIPQDKFLSHLRSWMGVPLVTKGQSIGMLTLSYSKPERFSSADARLVTAFASQVAVAVENARLYQQAEQLAVMEERQRLARELHDSVTQALYSVTLYAEATRMAMSSGKQDIAIENLQELQDMAHEAMLDMRMLIFELHPPVLEEEGLMAALQARLAAVETRAGLQTEIQAEGERRLPLAVEEELFWIALEAFNNVVKHARAQKVAVRLRLKEGSACLEIQDDGRGFDPAVARQSGGMGLRGMEERARRIGGQLEIKSAPGKGTTLQVTATV